MPLVTRIIDVPLFTGLDTKTEEKSVQNKLLVLDNAVMERTGEIEKRHGYEALGTGTTNNTGLLADDELYFANSLHSYKDQLVMVGRDGGVSGENSNDGPHIFCKGESFNKWLDVGNYIPVTYTTQRVGKPDQGHSQASVAEGGGFRCFVYEYSGHTQCDLVDKKTGVSFREKLIVNNVAEKPQVIYIEDAYGSNFLALGMATTSAGTRTIDGRYLDISDPAEQGTAVTISGAGGSGGSGDLGDLHPFQIWDMDRIEYPAHTVGDAEEDLYPDGTEIDGYHQGILVWKRGSDDKLQMATVDGHGNVHKSRILEINAKNAVCVKYINDPDGNGERIFLLYQDNATGNIDGYTFNPDLSPVDGVAYTISTALTSEVCNNITIASDPQSGNGRLRVFMGVEENREDFWWIRTNTVTWDLSSSSNARSTFHVGLASKAFTHEEQAYVLTVHESGLQSTYFLMTLRESTDPVYVAKIFYGVGGGVRKRSNLSAVVNELEGQYAVACTRQSRLINLSTRDYQVCSIDFNMNPKALQSVRIGPTLLIGGGIITGFDRHSQEIGFHLYPENVYLDTGGSGSTGGAMGDGYRSYRAVYQWTDRNGDVYYSAPSEAVGRTYAAGTNTQSDTLYAPYLNQSDLNNKTDGSTGKIEVYRTVAGGSTFHLVVSDSNANNALLDELTTSGVGDDSDEVLLANNILYTTGGVLPNIAPPASNILAANKSRVFLVPMDDPEAVWFSKEKIEGIGLEFSDELIIRIPTGDKNTGLATLDDKLIIFKEREIYFVAGEGPNDLGQGGFSPVRQIQTDVGCVDAASVVNIGIGVMFKSHKGIYIIDRSLQVSYIGAPVEKWNSYEVLSADLIEDRNQVRFLLDGGQGILCYDFFHNQWSHFTNHPGRDAVVHNGVYHWLKDDAVVRRENNGFQDLNFVIPMKVKTGWIKLSGMQGYQRVRRASIIGDYKSPHRLTVKVYTDYDDVNVSQTVSFDTSDSMSGNEPLQFEIHIKNQKCQAIMFEIYDERQRVTLESCSLTAISLECAIKRGPNKLPARKRK